MHRNEAQAHVGSKMVDDEKNSVEERLASHSAYFNSLIDLVPVKYYLPANEEQQPNKYYKNCKQKAPKENTKEVLKEAKRARLDPNQHKTVHEIQLGLEENELISSLEDKEQDEAGFSVEKIQSGNIEELKSRLRARIEEFQRKRNAPSGKADKQPRKSKPKREMKAKNRQKKTTVQSEAKDSVKESSSPNKTILNDNGEVVFSKFDFMEKKKGTKHGSKEKRYSKLLAKAEAEKKKLATLQTEDAEKAKELKDKDLWNKALQKAEGVKLYDDPKLLKKSMKRRDQEKKKSRKQWKERMDYQKKQIEEKQKLRMSHVKERIEAKKAKKLGKGKKKHRPGF